MFCILLDITVVAMYVRLTRTYVQSTIYTDISFLLISGGDAVYQLAIEFLPTVACAVRRVQLWQWLYTKVDILYNNM